MENKENYRGQGSDCEDSSSATPKSAVFQCKLNSKSCLSLSSILKAFSAPINEEHAWALCYQFAKVAKTILAYPSDRILLVIESPNHVILHKDGHIHKDTFYGAEESKSRPPMAKGKLEGNLIYNLGSVIFDALNFGLGEDEERHLSPDLQSLLESMNSADGDQHGCRETDDEGIGRDSGDSDEDRTSSGGGAFNFGSILQMGARRLGSQLGVSNGAVAAADAHYKAVCRALVAESVELSTFLQRVSFGTKQLRSYSRGSSNTQAADHADLDQLNFNDWARLWIQVVDDLRNGVKLKKVDPECHGPPIEYTLTPYEILMDDIRSRRYHLNKVQVNKLAPRLKKNAHDLILDFIRSRPPLRKAADRKLRPPPYKKPTPIELLMESIRQTNADHLRHVPRDEEPLNHTKIYDFYS